MQRSELKLLMDSVRHVGHGFHRQFNSVVEGTGVKGHHVRYLAALHKGGMLSAKDLSEGLRVDKGHTSRVLSDLRAFGLVEDGERGRTVPVRLTAAGKELAEALDANLAELAAEVAERISDEDFAAFLRVMETTQAILDEKSKNRTGGIL